MFIHMFGAKPVKKVGTEFRLGLCLKPKRCFESVASPENLKDGVLGVMSSANLSLLIFCPLTQIPVSDGILLNISSTAAVEI